MTTAFSRSGWIWRLPASWPKVERHLVVARPAGMQLRPGRHPPRQLGFDVHVDVFELRFPAELAGGNLPVNGIQPFDDGAKFRPREQPGLVQHRRMGC